MTLPTKLANESKLILLHQSALMAVAASKFFTYLSSRVVEFKAFRANGLSFYPKPLAYNKMAGVAVV